ncbi:hypothetical protein BHE74_00057587 [Ensete ventricosum]|nr:hypothetical protein BHE74_00057587 [Ensete ventricosum]
MPSQYGRLLDPKLGSVIRNRKPGSSHAGLITERVEKEKSERQRRRRGKRRCDACGGRSQLYRGALPPQATPRPAPPGRGFPTRGPPPATTAAAPSLVRLLRSLLGNQRPTALRDPRECTNLDISFHRWPSRSFMGLDWRRNGACDPWRGFALCRCGLGLLLLVPQISKASTSKSLPLGFPTLVAERFEFKLYSSWVVESFCALNFDFFFFTSILQLTVSMGLNGSSPRSSIVANAATRYAEDKPDRADEPLTTNSTVKSINEKLDMDAHVQEEAVVPTKRGAKIHDFCLGIPFGKPIPNFNSECSAYLCLSWVVRLEIIELDVLFLGN